MAIRFPIKPLQHDPVVVEARLSECENGAEEKAYRNRNTLPEPQEFLVSHGYYPPFSDKVYNDSVLENKTAFFLVMLAQVVLPAKRN
jgi:hypothetical protein